MRFAFLSLIIALLAAYAMAVAPHRSVIMSWPNETPDHIIRDAKQAIKDAHGIITHEYNIIKGFAAEAPASVFETVNALSGSYKCEIEDDGVVRTQDEK